LVFVLAVVLRRQWYLLFGPVFFYDLVRTARRNQQIAHRVLYAVFLTAVLFIVYWSWFPYSTFELDRLVQGVEIASLKEKARFAASFFTSFMVVQSLVVAVVTPAYTAGAITDEKEKRTLEFLLATDLTNREIVIGMMASRMANLFLLVMTGLPILCLLEFLGGVDPNLVLGGFLATGMTILTLGSLSILMSVFSKTSLTALVHTYFWTAVLFVGSGCCGLTYGIPIFRFLESTGADEDTQDTTVMVLILVLVYAGIQGLIIMYCCRRAIRNLRNEALGVYERDELPSRLRAKGTLSPQSGVEEPPSTGWGPFPVSDSSKRGNIPGSALTKSDETPHIVIAERDESRLPYDRGYPRRKRWPPLTGDALRWKEINTEKYMGLPNQSDALGFLFLATLFLFFIVFSALALSWESGKNFSQYFNAIVRGLATPVSCLLFLVIALNAARRMTRERERQTLDSLLTIPVERQEILFAKWVASVMSVGGLWLLPPGLWILGLLTGGLHVVAFPLILGATLVYAAFFSMLGLWFSTINRMSLRSTLFTLLAVLVLLLGPVLLSGLFSGRAAGGSSPEVSDWGELLVDYGLSPPATLWTLAFHSGDLYKGEEPRPVGKILAAVAGVHGYLIVTGLLWLSAMSRLNAEKGLAPRRGAFGFFRGRVPKQVG
jgi:ABC-type transport system involved in multi-copper enzyme maturation permease subunit